MQHCLLYEKPSERKHRHNQSLHDTVKPANLILDQHLQVETCALREMQGKNEIIGSLANINSAIHLPKREFHVNP